MDFVIVPLPDLWNSGVEAPDIFIEQIVMIVSTKLCQRFRDFAFRFGCDVFPDRPTRQPDFRRHRVVGVYRVAAVNEKIRLELPHRLVDAHSSECRIDAIALTHGVGGPYEPDIARPVGRRSKVAL